VGGELTKEFVCAFAIVLAGSALAQDEHGAVKENICYTESIEAESGTSFAVGVYVSNVDTLVGMQVPIYYRSDDVDLRCDSVTFDGSRCQNFSMSFFKIEPEEKVVFFALLNISDPEKGVPALYAGDGLVARLWFTAPEDSGPGRVVLESGPDAYFPHDRINYGYLFWNPAAVQVKCGYKPGNITLK
jgi:hypothetical protein